MNTLHRVLLVEDSEADRYLAARLLGKVWPGLEVVEARNGVEAIELLERCAPEGLPQIILLDINMPRMNGHEFLEAWYASKELDIPVVMMLTSSGQSVDRERTVPFRCVRDYVVKPIDREAVVRLPDLLAAA